MVHQTVLLIDVSNRNCVHRRHGCNNDSLVS
jgi:hypothetical protein